jgi:hypothetical protein
VAAGRHNFIAARRICPAEGLAADGEARLNKPAPAHLDELRNLAPVLDQLVAGRAAHDRDAHR